MTEILYNKDKIFVRKKSTSEWECMKKEKTREVYHAGCKNDQNTITSRRT